MVSSCASCGQDWHPKKRVYFVTIHLCVLVFLTLQNALMTASLYLPRFSGGVQKSM